MNSEHLLRVMSALAEFVRLLVRGQFKNAWYHLLWLYVTGRLTRPWAARCTCCRAQPRDGTELCADCAKVQASSYQFESWAEVRGVEVTMWVGFGVDGQFRRASRWDPPEQPEIEQIVVSPRWAMPREVGKNGRWADLEDECWRHFLDAEGLRHHGCGRVTREPVARDPED